MTVAYTDGMSLMLHHNIVDVKTCLLPFCRFRARTISTPNAKDTYSGWTDITQEANENIQSSSNLQRLIDFSLDALFQVD